LIQPLLLLLLLFDLYQRSLKALLRLYSGSIKALRRLSQKDAPKIVSQAP
jgi:hypothetical protein